MKTHLVNSQSRRGFTLVELSIVLVIIGLIIGGVLTGQQIIQNARVTNAINGIQSFESQFQTYAQNFGALPGDDSSADTRFSGATKGNGDGTVDGVFDSTSPADESRLAWADLRAAGLIKNQVASGSTAAQPPNPFNGIYGFQKAAFNNGISSNVVCLNNVPGNAAQAIDTRLDDGVGNAGAIQAMVSTGTVGEALTSASVATYDAAKTYTMCARM